VLASSLAGAQEGLPGGAQARGALTRLAAAAATSFKQKTKTFTHIIFKMRID